MSGGPRAVVIGTGRVAGGFIAPHLADAGWSMLLVGRDPAVVRTLSERGELTVRIVGRHGYERRVRGVSAVAFGNERLTRELATADLVATAVGPTALVGVGRQLAPLLRPRLEGGPPLNLITFENHRRAPELLTAGLLEAEPSLASAIGTRLGVGGAAVWRAIASRRIGAHGVSYDAEAIDECHVEEVALLRRLPPLDGSLPGLRPTAAFDDRMVEKMWLFNAGHAAAAFLGWAAGCRTVAEAMGRSEISLTVQAVVEEARYAFAARQQMRRAGASLPVRPTAGIMARYADAALADPVIRVAREPRRKLAVDDRLIAPALTCLAAGVRPNALALAIAAALAYAEPTDQQACDLRDELEHVGPEEVLATVGRLDPGEELSRLVSARYRPMQAAASEQRGARSAGVVVGGTT